MQGTIEAKAALQQKLLQLDRRSAAQDLPKGRLGLRHGLGLQELSELQQALVARHTRQGRQGPAGGIGDLWTLLQQLQRKVFVTLGDGPVKGRPAVGITTTHVTVC